MSEKKGLKKEDVDFLKELFSASKAEAVSMRPVIKKKPKVSPPIKAYMERTGEDAFDEGGEKTARYEEWYRIEWPLIKAEREEEVESTTVTTTTYKKREKVAAAPNLSLLIQESVNTLRTLTEYIKDLKENPIKVQIIK